VPYDLSKLLVVGVSSRALFDLEEEERLFKTLGLESYRVYQLEKENELLEPGTAFPLIKGLLELNNLGPNRRVEIVIVSKNHPETGIRMFHSIRHYGLDITRAQFTGGEALNPYLRAFDVDLFLSCSSQDVLAAIDDGIAAAVLYKPPTKVVAEAKQLRIAFDADAVLFSEHSEAIFREHGLSAFLEHEAAKANEPLGEGPLAKLLKKLSVLQEGFEANEAPLRLAIVTARNSPAHERVIKTLRAWNVRIDAAFFLGGVSKDRVLEAFGAHIFFDDQEAHLASTSFTTPSALVPYRSDSILRVEAPVADIIGREAPAIS
jgi:5'-nucleotidase